MRTTAAITVNATVQNRNTAGLTHIFNSGFTVAGAFLFNMGGQGLDLVFSEKPGHVFVSGLVENGGVQPVHDLAGLLEAPHGFDDPAEIDGSKLWHEAAEGPAEAPEALGRAVGERLRAAAGDAFFARLADS